MLKKIYLLLSRTGTIPSRVIHSLVGGTFTHSSIALRPTTAEFYSFARRTMHNPFNAGFITENIHTMVFSKYPDCNCAIYSLEVSDEAYEKLSGIIEHCVNNSERYNYNFLGLIPTRLGIRTNRKYNFTCSQFVATVLLRSGAVELPKHPSLMMPNDFTKLNGAKQIYIGPLKNCNFSKDTSNASVSAESV